MILILGVKGKGEIMASIKHRASQQDYANSLSDSMRQARDRLIAEYIRGVMIEWNNQLRYLQCLIKRAEDDWYIERAAADCAASITYPYSVPQYEADFVEGIQMIQNKVLSKAQELNSSFRYNPVRGLLEIAGSDQFDELVKYFNQLEKCLERM